MRSSVSVALRLLAAIAPWAPSQSHPALSLSRCSPWSWPTTSRSRVLMPPNMGSGTPPMGVGCVAVHRCSGCPGLRLARGLARSGCLGVVQESRKAHALPAGLLGLAPTAVVPGAADLGMGMHGPALPLHRQRLGVAGLAGDDLGRSVGRHSVIGQGLLWLLREPPACVRNACGLDDVALGSADYRASLVSHGFPALWRSIE